MLHKLTMAGKCAAMLVAVGAGVGVMVLAAHAATVTLRTAQEANKRFTLRVPTTWSVKTPDGSAALGATAPVPTGGLPDSVDVVVHAALSGMTAQSCESEAEWVTQHFAHINFTTLSQGSESVGGYAAYAHVYTWKAPTGQSRWSTQVCIVHLGQVYVLTGTTANTASTLAAHRTVLTTIINSIRIQAHVVPAAQTPPSGPSQTH